MIPAMRILPLVLNVLVISQAPAAAASLDAYSEFLRLDPFGAVLEADQRGAGPTLTFYDSKGTANVTGARGAYTSFRLAAAVPEGGEYSVAIQWTGDAGGIETDLFREWFHYTLPEKRHFPDALIPVSLPYRSRMPEPDNKIDKQTTQTFWVDLWVPAGARPGVYRGEAILTAAGKTIRRAILLNVLLVVAPKQDAVAIDHNCYGTSWFAAQYPELRRKLGDGFFGSDEFFGLIHAYHRMFYEHHGVFHQLGYGHGGKVGPEFAPSLEGSGRSKRIADWNLYDRHYGLLLDGSAFKGTRRGPAPIPFVYLPINPEWPASYLWWGEPGYETEFVNVVREMERHFREKGWTQTVFEMFFNHKKRYKAFPWDGDETRFPEDNRYLAEYRRLLDKALPKDTPVKFRFRSDSSWMMKDQFKDLAGVIDFWVLGGSMLSWYKEAPPLLKARGDIVWAYGGTPSVRDSSGAITFEPFRCWMWGIDGFVRWLTTSPGSDPWFRFGGGDLALVYPGEKFGAQGPIPSLRLKLQRNAVQDVNLLDQLARRRSSDVLKEQAAHLYNGTSAADWWPPRPAVADMPAWEMTNNLIAENTKALEELANRVDSRSWSKVRSWILQLALEGK